MTRARLAALAALAAIAALAACASAPAPVPTAPAITAPAPTPTAVPASAPAPAPAPAPVAELPIEVRDAATRILTATLAGNAAWAKLTHLTDRIGHRLSGSKALDDAIAWATAALTADGHERVAAEPVLVPHWVRGEESATLLGPTPRRLALLGLGGSIGTPRRGVEAEVIVAHSFDELTALGDRVKGKIVLFDVRMPVWTEEHGPGYGAAVVYRYRGASAAAKQGAVAMLLRSLTARSLRSPHTGSMGYEEGVAKIPAAALSIEDAELLARLAAAGAAPRVRLVMGAKQLPDAPSANVVAELRGRERPDEIVVIGGHLDSWDVGQGAHDDGAGCVIAMEALSMLRKLGLRPRRTIRVVLYTNEENGVRGARGYAAAHKDELTRHVAAIESDSGGFAPWGFSASEETSAARLAHLARLTTLLAPIGATRTEASGSGTDVEISLAGSSALLLGLGVDGSHYFDYHHSDGDTLDKVDPGALSKNVAAMAVMAYALAELDLP